MEAQTLAQRLTRDTDVLRGGARTPAGGGGAPKPAAAAEAAVP